MAEIPENNSAVCEVCRQPTERRCSACKTASYCSPEHQKAHWKDHQEKCRPFEIGESEQLGKFLKATRDLQPGDVIFSELPLVLGPKPHGVEEGPVPCVGCLRLIEKEKSLRCPECFWPVCSTECEGLKNNFRHGLECRVLQLKVPTPEDSFYSFYRFDILIILRALFLQKTNKSKWDTMLTLKAHLDKRAPGTDIFLTVHEKVNYLRDNYLNPLEKLQKESGKVILEHFTDDLIHKIYAILDVNASELTEDIDAEILYHTASLLEHNCTPNTLQIIGNNAENYRITFKAALPIKKNDHITSMYTHILWGTQLRREHLKFTKYFSCTCDRCKDPTEFGTYLSALKCLGTENDPCGGIQLPTNPIKENVKWICDKCKIVLPNEDLMKFVEHLGGEVEKVIGQKPSLAELEELLEKLSKFLHPNHYHIYTVKHTLVQLYKKSSDGVELSNNFFFEKIEMCKNLIEITRKIDPGNSRLGLYLGVLLHELFTAQFTILEREEKKKHVKEIQDLMGIIQEGQKVVEGQGSAGAKMMGVIKMDEAVYQQWLKKNQEEEEE